MTKFVKNLKNDKFGQKHKKNDNFSDRLPYRPKMAESFEK